MADSSPSLLCVIFFRFVDTAARAASINATHTRLLALMARADTVNDVLSVQRELQVLILPPTVHAAASCLCFCDGRSALSCSAIIVATHDFKRVF